MLIKFPAKTKYFFNFVLPFALLFQWTLPTIEKEIYIHINFGDLIYDKCNDPEHFENFLYAVWITGILEIGEYFIEGSRDFGQQTYDTETSYLIRGQKVEEYY